MANPNLITEDDEEQEGQNGQPANLSILTEGTKPPAAAPAGANEQDDTPEFEIVDGDDEGQAGQDDGQQSQTPARRERGRNGQDDQDQDEDGPVRVADELPNGRLRERRWSKNARHRYQRDRDRQEIETLRTQLDELRQQQGAIAPRLEELNEANVRSQRDQITGRVSEAERKYNDLNHLYYSAIKEGDFDKAAEIGQRRDDALVERTRVNLAKEEFDRKVAERAAAPRPAATEQRPAAQVQTQQQPIPPAIARLAREFVETYVPWMGQEGYEDESAVMTAIEQRVYQDGFDPKSDEFWDEVYDRGARVMPHRFRSAPPANGKQPAERQAPPKQAAPSNVQPLRRGPPTGAPGNGRSSSRNPAKIVLSKEHKEALQQAGLLDDEGRPPTDPEGRKKFWSVAKQYATAETK